MGTAIAQMAIIVEKLGHFLNDNHIKGLCIALDILRSDTALPSYDELYDTDVQLFLKRPSYRRWSAMLAFSIHQYLSLNNKTIPEVIYEWEKICETDPLPEVRHAWKES